MPSSPAERALAARANINKRWAFEPDRTAATAPARRTFMERFEREVDPDGVLTPAERARRAESLRKSYFQRLALKSARARRKAKEATDEAVAAEAEMTELGGAADAVA